MSTRSITLDQLELMGIVKCPNMECNAVNHADEILCRSCGQQLETPKEGRKKADKAQVIQDWHKEASDYFAGFAARGAGLKTDYAHLTFDIAPMAVQSCRFSGGRAYQPSKVAKYKTSIASSARRQLAADWKPIDGALDVSATFVFPLPKSMQKKERIKIEAGEIVRKMTRPDIDNLWKGTADALTGILWIDDSQIVYLSVKKIYGVKGQIMVTALNING